MAQPGMNIVNCGAAKCAFYDNGLCNAGVIDITSEADGIKCATYRAVETENEAPAPVPSQPPPQPARSAVPAIPAPPRQGAPRMSPGLPIPPPPRR